MTSPSPRLIVKPQARRRLSSLGLALGALSLSGCDSIQAPLGGRSAGPASTSRGPARSWSEVWQRVRQAAAIEKAADQRFLAARDNNSERFAQAQSDLALLQLYSPAEAEVLRAQAWSSQGQQAVEPAEKTRLEASEAASYRHALQLSPGGEFSSRDPELLNALGYFLADKGHTLQDFERAERLTRRAVQQHDKAVSQAQQQGEESTAFLSARYSRAKTRDSLAWALFKQATAAGSSAGRASELLRQARREQEAALDEARQALAGAKGPGVVSPSLSAEMPYHLAMILRAQNALAPDAAGEEQAQALLREALALDPKFQAAREGR